MKKRALFIVNSKYKDHELIYPYYRVLGAGFETHVVADKKDSKNKVYGIHGAGMPCDSLLSEFSENSKRFHQKFDLLILPGGVDNTGYLRTVPEVQNFLKEWNNQNKIISLICHAPQLLISAGITKGRKLAGFYTIKDDIINSGAQYIEAPVVIDRNIISSPHYDDMGIWMEKTLEIYHEVNK